MAITALTITPTKTRGNDTVDHSVLGLADPLGYTIAAAGTGIVATAAAVSFTSFSGASIATGTCILTPSADGTTAAGTGELAALDRWTLKTTHNAGGDSTLTATAGGQAAAASIRVVIASPWGIKARQFPGKPDRITDDGLDPPVTFDVMPDSTVQAAIEAGIAKFEAMSNILLRKRTFATRALKQAGDVEVGALDLNAQTGKSFMTCILPHFYLRDTPDVQVWYGSLQVFPPPAEWRSYTIDRRLGIVRHVPVTTTAAGTFTYALNIGASAPFFPLASLMNGQPWGNAMQSPQTPPYSEGRRARVPEAIQYRYQAGWPEEDEPIPAHWIQWIERDVALSIASDWERALTDSLASMSLSKDGLSRSISNSDPQMVKWTESMQKRQDEDWKRIALKFPVRPLVLE